MVDINRIVISQNDDEFRAYLEGLASLSDDEQRHKIINDFRAQRPNHAVPSAAEHGIFERDLLRAITQFFVWQKLGSSIGLKGAILERIFDRFIDENLFVRFTDQMWQLNRAIKSFWDSGNLPFYVLGLPHVAQVMSQAVVAINVRNDRNDIECGSGVILRSDVPGIGLVLTNRHVVENNSIIEVTSAGRSFERISEPILSNEADLAKFNVILADNIPIVVLALDAVILDEIVAIGYPRVPTSVHQSAMAHRGEINGTISTIDGRNYSAISCHVSPGNSGGPIFNRYGYCAGLVTQSGTAKYASGAGADDGYAVAYHMAIPVEVLKDFVT